MEQEANTEQALIAAWIWKQADRARTENDPDVGDALDNIAERIEGG